MAPLSRRETLEAAAFYAATSLATIAWWLALILYPDVRPAFFGRGFSGSWMWLFLVPDLLSALVMSTAMLWALFRSRPFAIALAWIHFGAQGYAWCLTVGLAVYDPQAYWGAVAMTASAGIALAFAIRIQGFDILWGAFRFRESPQRTPAQNWKRSLVQTFWMWTIFLGVVPLVLALAERELGWNAFWIDHPLRLPIAALLFAAGGSLGLWAGWTMSRHGDGTPLPSECARRLVQSGPYRFIRNPMAFGGVLQGIMVGLAWGSPLIMLYAFIGGVWWEVLVRRLEEERLEAAFGEEYRVYRQSVRCWRVRLKARCKG